MTAHPELQTADECQALLGSQDFLQSIYPESCPPGCPGSGNVYCSSNVMADECLPDGICLPGSDQEGLCVMSCTRICGAVD
jgi:hypothetical protein